MIIKTVLLGLLSAATAGSVMYFGTLPDDNHGSDDAMQGDASPKHIDTSNAELDNVTPDNMDAEKASVKTLGTAAVTALGSASDSVSNTLTVKMPDNKSPDNGDITDSETVKRLPSLRDAISDNRVEKGSTVTKMAELPDAEMSDAETPDAGMAPDQQSEKPRKRWLDQYLKSQNKDKVVTEETPDLESEDESTSENEPVSATKVKDVEIEMFEQPIEPEVPNPPVAETELGEPANMLNDIIGASSDGSKSTRYFKIEDGVLVEVKRTDVTILDDDDESAERYDRGAASGDRILTVAFEEAARITKPALRDQAYFGILEYALREDNFVAAERALAKIKQIDMNYTGKSRIAVAFAQKGLPAMAFKMIDSVGDTELRDFMRLQVIEAMIAPERLPSQWREDTSN